MPSLTVPPGREPSAVPDLRRGGAVRRLASVVPHRVWRCSHAGHCPPFRPCSLGWQPPAAPKCRATNATLQHARRTGSANTYLSYRASLVMRHQFGQQPLGLRVAGIVGNRDEVVVRDSEFGLDATCHLRGGVQVVDHLPVVVPKHTAFQALDQQVPIVEILVVRIRQVFDPHLPTRGNRPFAQLGPSGNSPKSKSTASSTLHRPVPARSCHGHGGRRWPQRPRLRPSVPAAVRPRPAGPAPPHGRSQSSGSASDPQEPGCRSRIHRESACRRSCPAIRRTVVARLPAARGFRRGSCTWRGKSSSG